MNPKIVESAEVDPSATIGPGSSIWHLVQVRENVTIGANCVVGRGAYVGPGVEIGDNVKIQNYALVYDPARLGDGVFIGPAAVLTNDVYPRSVAPSGEIKDAAGWESVGVQVGDGASIGARAVVLAGVTVGAWALVGAGAVVVRDVPDHALVVGNPAVRKGWVGRSGTQLRETEGVWICPGTGERYRESDAGLELL
jgi:acetyltransferase-like isoleucine patch superfamily enzyme